MPASMTPQGFTDRSTSMEEMNNGEWRKFNLRLLLGADPRRGSGEDEGRKCARGMRRARLSLRLRRLNMAKVIDITPYQILGRLEGVADILLAQAASASPPDDRLLRQVDRFRELLRELGEAIQRQRLNDQLNLSLELAGRSVDALRREESVERSARIGESERQAQEKLRETLRREREEKP